MNRLFIGFNNVAGYGTRLTKGFKEIGVEAHLYVEGEHKYGFNAAGLRYYKVPKNKWLQRIYTRIFFIKSIFRYDAFLFITPQTFIKDFKDLKVLRLFKKRTMMIFAGCDIQQPEVTFRPEIPYSSCHNCLKEYQEFVGCYPAEKIKRTRRLEGLLDLIMNDRAITNVLTRDSYHINQPINIEDFPETVNFTANDIPVIFHAPSNFGYKGSKFLIEAIEELKKDFNFKFKLVSNVNIRLLYEEIKKSDLVVDQLIQGWYGMLPLEAMMFEKPVICYLRDDVIKALPEDCPIINANPSTIYEVLKFQLENRSKWKEIGKKGREFVKKYHDAKLIANQYAKLLFK